MSYFSTNSSSNAFKNTSELKETDFLGILSSNDISLIIEQNTPEHRERIYTPTKTLAMFIKQALNSDYSCARAVNEFIIDNLESLPKNISKSTGSFCRSRKSCL